MWRLRSISWLVVLFVLFVALSVLFGSRLFVFPMCLAIGNLLIKKKWTHWD